MIQEAKQSYRGVLCTHCRQPIPLPKTIAKLETPAGGADSGLALELGPRVYTLRCRACQGESLYSESKFIDCEGTPRMRHTLPPKASPTLRPTGNLSRAANG
jgi:hypothetical protein